MTKPLISRSNPDQTLQAPLSDRALNLQFPPWYGSRQGALCEGKNWVRRQDWRWRPFGQSLIMALYWFAPVGLKRSPLHVVYIRTCESPFSLEKDPFMATLLSALIAFRGAPTIWRSARFLQPFASVAGKADSSVLVYILPSWEIFGATHHVALRPMRNSWKPSAGVLGVGRLYNVCRSVVTLWSLSISCLPLSFEQDSRRLLYLLFAFDPGSN